MILFNEAIRNEGKVIKNTSAKISNILYTTLKK